MRTPKNFVGIDNITGGIRNGCGFEECVDHSRERVAVVGEKT